MIKNVLIDKLNDISTAITNAYVTIEKYGEKYENQKNASNLSDAIDTVISPTIMNASTLSVDILGVDKGTLIKNLEEIKNDISINHNLYEDIQYAVSLDGEAPKTTSQLEKANALLINQLYDITKQMNILYDQNNDKKIMDVVNLSNLDVTKAYDLLYKAGIPKRKFPPTIAGLPNAIEYILNR